MRYKDTDPANLYRDCFGYVVNCTMANCHHLSLEDAEDIMVKLTDRKAEAIHRIREGLDKFYAAFIARLEE